jgi:hypothetical protein
MTHSLEKRSFCDGRENRGKKIVGFRFFSIFAVAFGAKSLLPV